MKNGILYNIAFMFDKAYFSVYREMDRGQFPVSDEQRQWITQWRDMTKQALREAYNELQELYAKYPAFEQCIKTNETYDLEQRIEEVRKEYATQIETWELLTCVMRIGWGTGDLRKSDIVTPEIEKELKDTQYFSRILYEAKQQEQDAQWD